MTVLISALLHVHDDDGSTLSEEDLMWTVVLLVDAGFETTVGQISIRCGCYWSIRTSLPGHVR